jgi:hypothetical protein
MTAVGWLPHQALQTTLTCNTATYMKPFNTTECLGMSLEMRAHYKAQQANASC